MDFWSAPPVKRIFRNLLARELCLATVVSLCLLGCERSGQELESNTATEQKVLESQSATSDASNLTDAQLVVSATDFCANCHAMPQATSFPKRFWPREVQRGFDFYFASGRADLVVPQAADMIRYFSDLAPEVIKLPMPEPLDAAAAARFVETQLSLPVSSQDNQAVAGASLQYFDWESPIGKRLMLADMRGGGIYSCSFEGNHFSPWETVASLSNPCRLTQCSLDDDGQLGLLVADLGSFLPADHRLGRVVWLRRTNSETLEFTSETVLAECGRVADVQAADLDADGDTDVVVADFGWHETGRLIWLERVTSGPATAASFTTHVLDQRAGTVEVCLVDMNDDGRLDIVSLIAQEFESIMVFLNQGDSSFDEGTTLYAAPDPAYGSSGMQIQDLDQDGDLDIVYTNGDSFDSFEVKPHHAVHWLENLGQLQFVPHSIARLPGVHRAVAVDLDDDSDLDIVASSFLPRDLRSHFPSGSQTSAIVWLENDGMQNFRVRPIQVDRCLHPALCVADFNDDGQLDMAVANFYEDAHASPSPLADILLAK
ncbi:MAG: VCBS repeat-containing protein [Aureliella sp.]